MKNILNFVQVKSKILALVISLGLIATLAVVGSVAWYSDKDNLGNNFSDAQVSCVVVEDFDGTTKENVSVKSTSNIDAYIRVAVVMTWQDAEENAVNLKVLDTDYDLVFANTKASDGSDAWFKAGNYYYYKDIVSPDKTTGDFLDSVKVNKENDYNLNVQILAEAIQASKKVAEEAWGADVASKLI